MNNIIKNKMSDDDWNEWEIQDQEGNIRCSVCFDFEDPKNFSKCHGDTPICNHCEQFVVHPERNDNQDVPVAKYIQKYMAEHKVNKAILNKTAQHFNANKALMKALEDKLYGLVVIDGMIYKYTDDEKKLYFKNPKAFREAVYIRSYKIAVKKVIEDALIKTKAEETFRKCSKTRLAEKISLRKCINELVNGGIFKDADEMKKKAYEFYNKTYNKNIDIKTNNLFNDVKIINIYKSYLYMTYKWSVDEMDDLSDYLEESKPDITIDQ